MPYQALRPIALRSGETIGRGDVIPAAKLADIPGWPLIGRSLDRIARYRPPTEGEPPDTWVVAGQPYKADVNGEVVNLPLGTELPDIEQVKTFFWLRRSGRISLAATKPTVTDSVPAKPAKAKAKPRASTRAKPRAKTRSAPATKRKK